MPKRKKADMTYRGAPSPPWEIVEEYRKHKGWSMRALAREMGTYAAKVSNICRGQHRITARTAVELELAFDRPARWWMELQLLWDLHEERRRRGDG